MSPISANMDTDSMTLNMEKTDNKEVLCCAALIANLEGQQKIPFPGQEDAQLELPSLERRLRDLEFKMGVISPPPMTDRSWEALGYRLIRLNRRGPGPRFRSAELWQWAMLMLPNAPDVSNSKILEIVAGIPWETKPSWLRTKISDENEEFSLILQYVCYLKGQRNFGIVPKIIERPYLYAAATEISLDFDTNMFSGLRPPAVFRCPPPPQQVMQLGCKTCNCKCHKKHKKSSAASDITSYLELKRPSLGERIRRSGLFRTLFCLRWKKSSKDSESSSLSSRDIVYD